MLGASAVFYLADARLPRDAMRPLLEIVTGEAVEVKQSRQ